MLSKRVNHQMLTKKSKTKTEKTESLNEPNKNSIVLENNCHSLIIDNNIFVIEGLQHGHEDIEFKTHIPDLPITESGIYLLNLSFSLYSNSIN